MKTAIYPGSFDPWHAGHTDILFKAKQAFDEVIILQMINPEKIFPTRVLSEVLHKRTYTYMGLLVDAVKEFKADAVIRGLRNGHDLQYEMNQYYWNQDLGLEIPVVCFITDRKLSHISSSAVRMVEKLGMYNAAK